MAEVKSYYVDHQADTRELQTQIQSFSKLKSEFLEELEGLQRKKSALEIEVEQNLLPKIGNMTDIVKDLETKIGGLMDMDGHIKKLGDEEKELQAQRAASEADKKQLEAENTEVDELITTHK